MKKIILKQDVTVEGQESKTFRCVTKSSEKYPSRCSCVAKLMPCTSECECQGCENPFGIRPLQLGRVVKRQRIHRHAKTVCESVRKKIYPILDSYKIPTLVWWTRRLFKASFAKMKMEKTSTIDKKSIKFQFNQTCHATIKSHFTSFN